MVTPARTTLGSGWGPKSGLAATMSAFVVIGSGTRPRIESDRARVVSTKSVPRAIHLVATASSAVITTRRLGLSEVTSSTIVRNCAKCSTAHASARIMSRNASASYSGVIASGDGHLSIL